MSATIEEIQKRINEMMREQDRIRKEMEIEMLKRISEMQKKGINVNDIVKK